MSQARTKHKINNKLGETLWFRTPCEKDSASSWHPDTKLSHEGSEQFPFPLNGLPVTQPNTKRGHKNQNLLMCMHVI